MSNKVGRAVLLFVSGAAAALAWQRFVHPVQPLASPARVTEARISAFAYEPLRSHGEKSANRTDAYDGLDAELQKELQTSQSPTSDRLHRQALLYLLRERGDEAEAYLQRAASMADAKASVWGDLAAVELERRKVFDAAEHAAHALEIDGANQTAAFNSALALELLHLRPLAEEAWQRYLQLDLDSEWAEEARAHLAHLQAPRPDWVRDQLLLVAGATPDTVDRIVREYPQRSRAKALKELLPAYVISGELRELEVLRRIAAQRASAGDHFLQDAVEHTAANRAALLSGFQSFAEGVAADAAVDMDLAARSFHDAAPRLRRAGSPVALAAALYAARSDGYNGLSEEALAQLEAAKKDYARLLDRYPSMATELAWFRGLVHLRRGKPRECLTAYREALAHAQRCGELEHAASILALIATQLDAVAEPSDAEKSRIEALRELDAVNAESRRMYTAYLESGTGALRTARPRVALAFLEAASRIGRAERNAMYLADCDAWRALALVDLGRVREAAEAIASARKHAPHIKTVGFRERTLANIAFITARIETNDDRMGGLAAYSEAIDFWDRKDWRMHLAAAYFARGETYRRFGDTRAAERDYRAAIAEMEDQRKNLAEPELRISYFERADRAFVRLIELLLDDGRQDDALSILERKRARVLLDHVASAATAEPLDARTISARMRPGVSLLHIALLDDRVQLWLTSNGHTMLARAEAPRVAVEQVVAAHLKAIEEDDLLAAKRSGRWLFDHLIAPVARTMPRDTDLIVVPDGILETFPFTTLVTPDGEFLVDRNVIGMTPSASVFLRSSKPDGGGQIVVVAQPAPAGFDALPDGYSEAVAIARNYPDRTRLLRGEECSPRRFLEEVTMASLIHFSGHARSDSRRASNSALIFESVSNGAEELTAETIGRARFRNDPLVVLAACGTGRGRVRRNEGVSSLASAFLQAGARGVIATLWDVEDQPAAALFLGLHQRLSEGHRPGEALREAQRAFLHSANPNHRRLSVWASVVVVGSI